MHHRVTRWISIQYIRWAEIPLHKSVFINGFKRSKDKITYHEINSPIVYCAQCIYCRSVAIVAVYLFCFSFFLLRESEKKRRRKKKHPLRDQVLYALAAVRPIKWNLRLNCKFIETVRYQHLSCWHVFACCTDVRFQSGNTKNGFLERIIEII